MGTLCLRGAEAKIRWVYYDAAVIDGYTVRRLPSGQLHVVGMIVHSDAFKMKQRPLTFVVPHRRAIPVGEIGMTYTNEVRVWCWTILAFDIDTTVRPNHIRATLGPSEP